MTTDLDPRLAPGLHEALSTLAQAETIVAAFDFDGTLAPLVDDPERARAVDGAIAALEELATMPGVTVALVSGRDLDTLTRLTDLTSPIVLIGSHGSQWSTPEDSTAMTEEHHATYRRLRSDLDRLLESHPQARLETKPASLVVHTRGLPAEQAEAVLADTTRVLEAHPEVHTTPGKDVLEMAVLDVGKGPAIVELARRSRAGAVLFAGDDVTDERAFEVLAREFGDAALTIKVGAGQSAATHRITDEAATVGVIRTLAQRRI